MIPPMPADFAAETGPRRFDLRRGEIAIALAAAVFLAGFAVAAALVGGREVLADLGRLEAATVAGVLALSFASYGFRATRWLIYSRRIGVRLSAALNLLYYFAGFAFTPTPSKVGEMLRHWLLRRGHGYAYARTLPLWVADRLNDTTATLILILVGLSGFAHLAWSVAGFGMLFAGFVTLIARPGALLAVVGWLYGRIRRRARLFAGTRRLVRFSARLFAPRIYAVGVGLAVAAWTLECVAFHWVLAEMGARVTLLQAVFVFSFALLAGGISLMPGGLGGFEATMGALLLALDVPADVAVAATAVIRAATLWFAVGLGFAALPMALQRMRRGSRARA
jgi:glycosyltransferase 2 family protein